MIIVQLRVQSAPLNQVISILGDSYLELSLILFFEFLRICFLNDMKIQRTQLSHYNR